MIIIDYGVGNIGSIINMFKKIGVAARLSSSARDIETADRLLLPGVGSFDQGMKCLNASGLRPALEKRVLEDGAPVLGICLGMQLLCEGSAEGEAAGLGWIKGHCVKFDKTRFEAPLRVPHMGWNLVRPRANSPLFQGLEDEARFYFVHSYHMECADSDHVEGQTEYGYGFTSAVRKDNIFGAQFHPEKSHFFGMRLLKNFAEFNP